MFYDLIKSRSSIRTFKDQKIEAEKVDLLLKAALRAPSSRSIRPWEFVVVNDERMLEKLSHCRQHGSKFLAGAPLAIVVLAERDRCDTWIEDTTIAATFIQLMAQDLALGSCWIQVRERFQTDQIKAAEYIKQLLAIPDHYFVECIIAIGYPDEKKTAYPDESLHNEKIHDNQFKISKEK